MYLVKLFKWFFMLNKRLYKKATYIAILVMIPLCVLLLGIAAKQDSGFVHVMLALQDPEDKIAEEIVSELSGSSELMRFSLTDSTQEAVEAVRSGEADAAWLFPGGMAEKIDSFVSDGTERRPVVSVVEREESIPLALSREKLTAVMYKYCGKAKFLSFARTTVKKLDKLSDKQLMEYYNNFSLNHDMFQYGSLNASGADSSEGGYLTAPVRGLLAILIVICGMAAAMFYIKDQQYGTFNYVPSSKRIAVSFACVLIAVANVAVATFVSLYVAGLSAGLMREIAALLLYVLCSTAFCVFLQQLLGSIKLYGALIPLLIVAMIAVCPVFFNLKALGAAQLVFPPTYYINAIYNQKYLLYMLLYTLAAIILAFAARYILRRKI